MIDYVRLPDAADGSRVRIRRLMTIAKWALACKGKARPGDTPGMAGLHVWRREENGTATCKKCGETLNRAEAADCFLEW